MIKELDYPAYANAGDSQRISWGAVFAGATTSLAVFAGTTGRGLAASFGADSAVWVLLSGVISFYAGGRIAGCLTGTARAGTRVLRPVPVSEVRRERVGI